METNKTACIRELKGLLELIKKRPFLAKELTRITELCNKLDQFDTKGDK